MASTSIGTLKGDTPNIITNISIKLQSSATNALVASWEHSLDKYKKANLKGYSVRWDYKVGKTWYIGETSEVTPKQSLYTPPDIATEVRCYVKFVRKKTYTKKNAKKNPTTKQFGPAYYTLQNLRPIKAPTPSISVLDKKKKIEIKISNIDQTGVNKPVSIRLQILKDGKKIIYDSKSHTTITYTDWNGTGVYLPEYDLELSGSKPIKIVKGGITKTFTGDNGSRYCARAKCVDADGQESYEWSDWSSEVLTVPSPPTTVDPPKVTSLTTIDLTWSAVSGATSYKVLYATHKWAFTQAEGQVSSVTVSSGRKATITGLDRGYTYYFCVCAVNEQGTSERSTIVSTVFGLKPDPPTTWSQTTTVMAGDPIILYWVHNSRDNSSQKSAEIQLTVNDTVQPLITVVNKKTGTNRDTTSYYKIATNVKPYVEGAVIKWKIRTYGITDSPSDWSIEREINVYARPSLSISSSNFVIGTNGNTMTKFPLNLDLLMSPSTQTAISYNIEILAMSDYIGFDYVGNAARVSSGDIVFSKVISSSLDGHNPQEKNSLSYSIYPQDCRLEMGIPYAITATVSTDAGLIAESNVLTFYVEWDETLPVPDLSMYMENEERISMAIQPKCENLSTGKLESDVILSVYRIEPDGKFTEIETGIRNLDGATIVDPHPSLNGVTYRVVAQSTVTGEMSFNDIDSSEYFNGPLDYGLILQWDESYASVETTIDQELADSLIAGEFLRLPYNIEVSSNHAVDVSLIKYIGRAHPVSYYGTQLGETTTCSAAIDKEDDDTLSLIRQLAIYTGDVYVREPSGMGYWAQVDVHYQRKYNDLTIPVSFNITRVEGGK